MHLRQFPALLQVVTKVHEIVKIRKIQKFFSDIAKCFTKSCESFRTQQIRSQSAYDSVAIHSEALRIDFAIIRKRKCEMAFRDSTPLALQTYLHSLL